MKRTALIALSENGRATGEKLYGCFPGAIDLFSTRSFPEPWKKIFSLKDAAAEIFSAYSGIIFVMSAGIAVRICAPYIQSKNTDPAVVAVDEAGKFAVSLLSGHLGGANALAEEISSVLGTVPVITTATDAFGLEAVDKTALHYGMQIYPVERIKIFNRGILEGEKIHFYGENGIVFEEDSLPAENAEKLNDELLKHKLHALITYRSRVYFTDRENIIYMVPRVISLGAGCRKGFSPEIFEENVLKFLDSVNVDISSLKSINSIDAKRDEPAFISFAESYGIGERYFTASEINGIYGSRTDLSSSEWVKKNMNVPGVCEAAAVLGANGGRLIVKKTVFPGMTLALALQAVPLKKQNKIWFGDEG